MMTERTQTIFERILAEDAALIAQLSDAFKLLPDIEVIESASDRVEARCASDGFRESS